MSRKVEYWNLYSEKTDKFYRRIPKGDTVIPAGYYHICVEIIPTDMAGHMLVTRRSMNKKSGAGRYEFPAGSVMAGEMPMQAAVRELREETGLTAQKMIALGSNQIPGMKRYLYLAFIPDIMNERILLQPGETMGYRFVTYEEWLDLLPPNDNLFDTKRGLFYSPGIFQRVQELVGETSPSKRNDSIEPSVTALLKHSDRLSGTRGGLSGPSEFESDEFNPPEDIPFITDAEDNDAKETEEDHEPNQTDSSKRQEDNL